MNQSTLAFLADVPTRPAPHQLRQAPRPPAHYTTQEYGVVSLRECTMPFSSRILDQPEAVAAYARQHMATSPFWRPRVENFAVIFLNTRRRIIGHQIISNGSLDTLLVHARDVFYPAIEVNAAAIVLLHNHPSGDASPSDADIRVTRDLMRAGQLLKIDVLDHIILGQPHLLDSNPKGYVSLREQGHFYV